MAALFPEAARAFLQLSRCRAHARTLYAEFEFAAAHVVPI